MGWVSLYPWPRLAHLSVRPALDTTAWLETLTRPPRTPPFCPAISEPWFSFVSVAFSFAPGALARRQRRFLAPAEEKEVQRCHLCTTFGSTLSRRLASSSARHSFGVSFSCWCCCHNRVGGWWACRSPKNTQKNWAESEEIQWE